LSPRLAIVLSHPTQYYSPWFRWLATHTELVFRVFYLSDFGLKATLDEKFKASFAWDIDLTSGYEWELVPNTARRPDTLRFSGLRNPTLLKRIRAWQADAVLIFGYNYHSHLRLIAGARLRKLPLLFRGDSHLLGREQSLGAKRWLLSVLYRQFAAVTYVGQANLAYFRALRVPTQRLFFAPHAVDNFRFDPAQPESVAKGKALRQSLGLGDNTRVVLFAGKLIPEKQPQALLKAFAALPPSNDCALVFVGDGPEKDDLIAQAKQSVAPGKVHFLPFANQSEMPSRYLLADLFVLPSRGFYETWGLAVNEAMHLGIPCLVSDHVVSQRDLVTEGVTGWVFNPNDPVSLTEKLSLALRELEANASRFRAAVLERISHYTYAQASDGLLAALRFATLP